MWSVHFYALCSCAQVGAFINYQIIPCNSQYN